MIVSPLIFPNTTLGLYVDIDSCYDPAPLRYVRDSDGNNDWRKHFSWSLIFLGGYEVRNMNKCYLFLLPQSHFIVNCVQFTTSVGCW